MRYTDKFITIDGTDEVITIHNPSITTRKLYSICVKLWYRHTDFCKLLFPFSEYPHYWQLKGANVGTIKLGYYNGS